jgi:nucleoside 2-deoxyribosyltransferase
MKITICGSIAFYQEMENLKKSLENIGHEVFIPLLENEAPQDMGGGKTIYFGKYIEENGGMKSFSLDDRIWDLKAKAISDHYKKIEWCDAILVVNYEKKGIVGYIGGNTLIEMGVAFYLNKPIYILNQVSSEISYTQEIYGMKPIFINGDINKIS